MTSSLVGSEMCIRDRERCNWGGCTDVDMGEQQNTGRQRFKSNEVYRIHEVHRNPRYVHQNDDCLLYTSPSPRDSTSS
eukprot:1904496-Prorocentrum_lima.AAC.1